MVVVCVTSYLVASLAPIPICSIVGFKSSRRYHDVRNNFPRKKRVTSGRDVQIFIIQLSLSYSGTSKRNMYSCSL